MKGLVLSFFEYTGVMLEPWAKAGHECHAFDLQHPEGNRVRLYSGGGSITFHKWDASQGAVQTLRRVRLDVIGDAPVAMVFGFPPCTDLAASGARHWKKKLAADPECQKRAVQWAQDVAWIAARLNVPCMIENPKGAMSRLWRKPDHRFDPCDFGAYIPEDQAQHPLWPEYIPPRDAYTKETHLWVEGGFVMPVHKPVDPIRMTYVKGDGTITHGSPQWGKLGGKSLKTKNIRSATARGFAAAVFHANAVV